MEKLNEEKLQRTIGVVEHLREDDIGSGVDLLAEVLHLLFGRQSGLRVSFGETSNLCMGIEGQRQRHALEVRCKCVNRD